MAASKTRSQALQADVQGTFIKPIAPGTLRSSVEVSQEPARVKADLVEEHTHVMADVAPLVRVALLGQIPVGCLNLFWGSIIIHLQIGVRFSLRLTYGHVISAG